ncbi:alpha-(1,3)-fucosyltransferase C-like [Chironomus tepperi]|uniref:alpha-(1,3)-fucosyltransferase C-like n=1 Tax=Chironomus tepperi TaxID=113505 RepID=UPI00391F7711
MSMNVDKIKLIPKHEHQKLKVIPRKKLKTLIFLIIVTLTVLFIYTCIPRNFLGINSVYNSSDKFNDSESDEDNEYYDIIIDQQAKDQVVEIGGTKNILFWTRFFDNPDWYTGKEEAGEDVLKSVQCPVTNCFFTHNKELLGDIRKFDAIAFHGPEFRRTPLPDVRSPEQFYIFVSLESPTAVLDNLSAYKNFYNLSMTYRLDSDIRFDYGKVIDIKTNEIIAPAVNPKWKTPDDNFYDDRIIDMLNNKKKPVAWFVSNCYTKSNRNKLVAEIQKHIDVDIYGRCGKLNCPVDDQKCLDMLTADYKFYLSFENSLCKDYVTEKLYRPLTQYVIPIVFNGGNTTRFAPPKSYINANDYDTPEELVKYLKYLIDNPKEYVKYFWWKQHYTIKSHPTYPYTLCEMCKKFNTESFMKAQHRYEDINEWYRNRDMCNQKSHIKFDNH